MLSLSPDERARNPTALRSFLETLTAAVAQDGGLVVGEAEPGRFLLVMPALGTEQVRAQIDAGLELVLARLGTRWANPHVSDFGLRELYAGAREPWLARHGIEALVQDGELGVVTIFCHDWVYETCAKVATERGLTVQSPFEEYLRTGKLRVAAKNAFQLDVFANIREMAANFDPIDHVAAKLLVLAGLGADDTLASRLRGEG
jgi:hypothetical protein